MSLWHRDESVGLSHVDVELSLLLLFPLKHVDSRDVSDKVVDSSCREEGGHASHSEVASDQIDSPPAGRLSKVVWMSRELPEPIFHDLALILRIVLELGELIVSDRLEDEADKPE